MPQPTPSDLPGIQQQAGRQAADKAQQIKDNSYYKHLQKQLAKSADSKALWVKGTDAKGTTYHINASALAAQADLTTISTHDKQVKAPVAPQRSTFGLKIDFEEKMLSLKDLYLKYFIQSKSYNLIIAKLGGLKSAALGFFLSLLGTTSLDLKKLQQKALGMARDESKALYYENQYNIELLYIVSGGTSNKVFKGQTRVLQEISKQLLIQARNIGLDDYYTAEYKLETKIEVCKDILTKFKEEDGHLRYELEYLA